MYSLNIKSVTIYFLNLPNEKSNTREFEDFYNC